MQRPAVGQTKLGSDRVLERGSRGELGQRERADPDHERGLDEGELAPEPRPALRTIAAEGRTSPPPGRFPGKHLATAAM